VGYFEDVGIAEELAHIINWNIFIVLFVFRGVVIFLVVKNKEGISDLVLRRN
jgi:hypothetical protein